MTQMEKNVFYDLKPPAIVLGQKFHRVRCNFQVPGKPDGYVVRGIPEGGKEEEPFLLAFSKNGKVQASRSEDQNPLRSKR